MKRWTGKAWLIVSACAVGAALFAWNMPGSVFYYSVNQTQSMCSSYGTVMTSIYPDLCSHAKLAMWIILPLFVFGVAAFICGAWRFFRKVTP